MNFKIMLSAIILIVAYKANIYSNSDYCKWAPGICVVKKGAPRGTRCKTTHWGFGCKAIIPAEKAPVSKPKEFVPSTR